jgi:hypothetical protein
MTTTTSGSGELTWVRTGSFHFASDSEMKSVDVVATHEMDEVGRWVGWFLLPSHQQSDSNLSKSDLVHGFALESRGPVT